VDILLNDEPRAVLIIVRQYLKNIFIGNESQLMLTRVTAKELLKNRAA
jgi:hypothetical protein